MTETGPLKREERIKINSNLDTHKEIPLPDIQGFFDLENIGIKNPMKQVSLLWKTEYLIKAITHYDEVQKCWHTNCCEQIIFKIPNYLI